MTLQECYRQCGGDYEDTIGRLISERMVERFLLRFPDDRSYADLVKGLSERNGEAAFRAAHTLKGVASNLGLKALFVPASAMAEALRGGWNDEAPGMLAAVTVAYERVVKAIEAYKA